MWNFPIAPEQGSEHAVHVDNLFLTITALTIFFTVLVLALVIFFTVRYRVGSKANRDRPQHENLKIEIAWTLPPLLLGIAIFAWGAQEFVESRKAPPDAMNIFAVGKQWMWHIQHPNGVRENNELHVPLGVPVKVTTISQDVIHSFYIPEFRVQTQVIPGRYTEVWFTPTKTGKFYLFCGQYCGTQHSEMGGYVYVMSQTDYAQWLANEGDSNRPRQQLSMVEAGRELYTRFNCQNCHGGTDTDRGPSLYGIAGKARRTNAGSMVADDAYLRESLVNPYQHIVAGYSNTMPSYKGQLTEENILQLIAYMRSLGSAGQSPAAIATTSTSTRTKQDIHAETMNRPAPQGGTR